MRYIFYLVIGISLFAMALLSPAKFDGGLYVSHAKQIYSGEMPVLAVSGTKPNLIPSIIAINYRIFGVNGFSEQIVAPAFYLLALILLVGNLRLKISEENAIIAGFLFLTMILPFYHARNVYTDMPLAVCVMIGGIYLMRFWEEKKHQFLAYSIIAMLLASQIKASGMILMWIYLLVIVIRGAICKLNSYRN